MGTRYTCTKLGGCSCAIVGDEPAGCGYAILDKPSVPLTKITRAGVVDALMSTASFREDVRFLRDFLKTDNFLLAGGCLRDTLTGRPVNDLDVYVANKVPHLDITQEKFDGEEYYDHACILGQKTFEKGGRKVNVVLTGYNPKDGIEVIEHFDCGLCIIGFHPEIGFVVPDAFIRDVNNETITVLRKEWGLEGAKKHLRRLITKYPNYRVIDPEGILD